MVLIWGILLLPIGFAIQAVGLLRTRALPRWQGLLFLIGVLLIGTPDGVEIVNLGAAILLTIAFVPYGLRLVRGEPGDLPESLGPRASASTGGRQPT
jgi:hypothetical protein